MRENSWTNSNQESERETKKDRHTSNKQEQNNEISQKGMSTENNIGVQTRAMAQRVDNEANPEQAQRAMDQATTPTVELHRTKEDTIKEFVHQHGTISLDWYVPDLCNTRVGNLIEKRLQLETTEGRILFSSPALSEFFKTSNFELNLQTGEVLTYLDPPEKIGIVCQKDPFDIESLRDTLQGEHNTGPMQEERLERIPSVKKLVGPADVMPREEAEYKVRQYCHLWTMYADSSVELKKKSELSQESAVAACKMYVPYISDITRQIEEVVKIFAMEKELRLIKNRGFFPVPQLAPRECKIETIQDKEALIKEIDKVVVEMLNAIRESEENYKKEQEQARIREEQLRAGRQTSRSDINLYPTLANSTPIRNTNTRSDQPGVHFNTNLVHHVYTTTSGRAEQFEPPENDSIVQGATSSPADQFTTNTTEATGRNEPWRQENTTNIGANTFNHRTTTRPTGHNELQTNNPSNPTDLRNGLTCFRCGEQGHMRGECRKRVFCNHCRSYNHDTRTCRKQHDNTPSPTHSQIMTGYHPTVTSPPLMETAATTQAPETHNNPLFNLLDNNQPRTSTLMHTPHNGMSPAAPADLIKGITQIMNRVTNDNKRDDTSKKMMKNIKIFDSSNKEECISWLSQVEATAKFTNTPFRELICQSMAPAMLHVFSDLSALASDADIKEAILTNYSDIPSSTEAATRLQNIQFSTSEPLVTFNHRYEAIHKVAFKMSPNEQESKTVIVEYTFKQALDINCETSFVEAATGRYNEQNGTKIETQINKLSDSFQEYDINAMNTRSTNRSGDGSWNGSFDRSSNKNNSFNSSQNSRSNYRSNNYHSNNDSYNRQNFSQDNGRNRTYQQQPRYEQRNQNHINRYDNNQDRNRHENNQDRHRFDNRRRPNKYQHQRNQHKAQVIFEFSDQNVMEMMQMVRGFINLIKANPTTREHYKSNKLTTRKYDNEVNESEIQSSSLEQVQEFFNEDSDVIFEALVAADYIEEVECTDSSYQQQA